MSESMKYVRHYPCTVCGRVGDEILNGHVYTATNWPRGFFCSEECIEKYKTEHPNWKRDRDRTELGVEHNCYMRQFTAKEEWEKFEVEFDSENDRYVSQTGTFLPGEVLAMVEKYKVDAAEKLKTFIEKGVI